jgi:MarR family transcriptional regulator, transcriptional regulator for hemolysin
VVQLTQAGEATFLRLQRAAIACDARLRAGLADADLDNLSDLPGQLAANVGRTEEGSPPRAGLAESRRQK